MVNRTYYFFALPVMALVTTAITACDVFVSDEEKKARVLRAIGTDASITAAMLVSAIRSCQIVGVGEIDRCAELKGTLIADQTAQMLATVAVAQRNDYWKNCQASFDQEYCNQLIQRAIAIEYRKPRTPE